MNLGCSMGNILALPTTCGWCELVNSGVLHIYKSQLIPLLRKRMLPVTHFVSVQIHLVATLTGLNYKAALLVPIMEKSNSCVPFRYSLL